MLRLERRGGFGYGPGVVVAPEFDRPPVVEMALGIQFQPLFGLRGISLSPLREVWRERYPLVEEVPPLPPGVERVGGQPLGVQLAFGPGPALRYWFMSDDGADLVQLQNDRLIINWRSVGDGRTYPRYAAMRETFGARATDLIEFVEAEGLGRIDIVQAEANYINSLDVTDGAVGSPRFLRAWAGTGDHHLGDPVDGRVSLAFDVPDIGKSPVRLHVDVAPAPSSPEAVKQFMTLTLRGAPADTQLEGALAFFDEAHEHLDRSFLELTPTAMHAEWGVRQ